MLRHYDCDTPSKLPISHRRKWRLANALHRLAQIIAKDNMGCKPSQLEQIKLIHKKIRDKKSVDDIIDGIYFTLGFLNSVIEQYPANNMDAVMMAKACISTFGQNECSAIFDGLTDAKIIKKINCVQMNQNKLDIVWA